MGEEQGKEDLFVGHVDVHVPKAGDQVLPRAVDDPGAGGDRDVRRPPDRRDPFPLDDHGRVRKRRTARDVDDRYVDEGQGPARSFDTARRGRREMEKRQTDPRARHMSQAAKAFAVSFMDALPRSLRVRPGFPAGPSGGS